MKNDSIPVAIRSVGAIIRVGADRFLFQLRDDRPDVALPGRWGFFGGEVENDEDYASAIARELEEELELTGHPITFAAEFAVPRPRGWMHRKLFEVRLREQDLGTLTLNEGAAMKAMTAAEFLALDKTVYWDALGLAFVLQGDRP